MLAAPERERRRFACDGLDVIVSTRQRIPDTLGGEEYVYLTVRGGGARSVPVEIDNNGRWTERLGAQVSDDGSWVRAFLTEPAAQRNPYRVIAYVEAKTGTVIRFAHAYSTEEERAAGWFNPVSELPSEQTLRGHRVRWRPCP